MLARIKAHETGNSTRRKRKELRDTVTSPTVYCPFCGTPLKVLDTIPTVTSEGTANVCICKCGVMDVVIRQNKLAAIRIRQPEIQTDIRIMES